MGDAIATSEKFEKIWLTEWFKVRRHSRVLFLPLRADDVAIYDIQPGDQIRAQLQLIKKEPREEVEA